MLQTSKKLNLALFLICVAFCFAFQIINEAYFLDAEKTPSAANKLTLKRARSSAAPLPNNSVARNRVSLENNTKSQSSAAVAHDEAIKRFIEAAPAWPTRNASAHFFASRACQYSIDYALGLGLQLSGAVELMRARGGALRVCARNAANATIAPLRSRALLRQFAAPKPDALRLRLWLCDDTQPMVSLNSALVAFPLHIHAAQLFNGDEYAPNATEADLVSCVGYQYKNTFFQAKIKAQKCIHNEKGEKLLKKLAKDSLRHVLNNEFWFSKYIYNLYSFF